MKHSKFLSLAMIALMGGTAARAAVPEKAILDQSDVIPQPSASAQWVKRGIVLAGDDHGFQNFNSPAEPLTDGRWRIWYGHWRPEPNFGFAEGVPGGQMTKYEAVLNEGEPANAPLAIGNLPEGWRPIQPVHLKLKDGRDRLYFWVHS